MPALDHWPLFGLRITTPRIELRLPNDDEIAAIATRVDADGIHDPAYMPFGVEWTDVEPHLRNRQTMQHHWSLRASWSPTNWMANFATFVDGRVVGSQSMGAVEFATLRTVSTGSFLFLPEQGAGIGTEMRHAVLHLAFAELGAEYATSFAFADNAQSIGVTERLGYSYQGTRRVISRGQARDQVDYRLDRATWERQRRDDIQVTGLDRCRAMFGV